MTAERYPDARRARVGALRRWRLAGGPSTLLLALPMIVIFTYFSWWPIIKSLVLSVQKTNLITAPTWVGWENFSRVLADPLLGTAVGNTVMFTLISVLIGFPLPVLLAVFINELRGMRGTASGLAYLPVIVPPVVAVLLWSLMYDPSPDGVFNTILGWVGLGPLPWLQSPVLALPSIIVQATWAGFGTTTIIYLAALRSVPAELYEAAECDGAGVVRKVWHITLPQVRGIMLLMLLLQIIGVFQIFTEPFVMTGGGPNNSTLTILMLIYNYAFVVGDYGKATALSVLLAVVLSIVSAAYLWATRKWSK
ncbi:MULTISPECIES: carbohydrate ABC transporter permease [unclassified Microbacterium]|uniref:carbohydrate ABC transporter permease n=1 Tax=unclassified Microbacterium TaxID=2609290 RepID=UPI001E560F78|nr:sugar ABC transporter permease [Microbacterium sp. MAH-37]